MQFIHYKRNWRLVISFFKFNTPKPLILRIKSILLINDDLIKSMKLVYKKCQNNDTTNNIKDKQIELNFD